MRVLPLLAWWLLQVSNGGSVSSGPRTCSSTASWSTGKPPKCKLHKAAASRKTPLCDFGVITKYDAAIASHNNDHAFAIGGRLVDAAPLLSKTIAGTSWLTGHHALRSHDEAHEWPTIHFASPPVLGAPFPFDWAHFEYLAETLHPTSNAADEGEVHVRCHGGVFDFGEFCHQCPNGHDSPGGRNFLIVFNTEETVELTGTSDGRQWFGSVLAPYAHVIVHGSVGFVDGQIIAKSLEVLDSSVQLHGNCFRGKQSCCEDRKKCAQNLITGKWKCQKRKVQSKCAASCLTCSAAGVCPCPPSPPSVPPLPPLPSQPPAPSPPLPTAPPPSQPPPSTPPPVAPPTYPPSYPPMGFRMALNCRVCYEAARGNTTASDVPTYHLAIAVDTSIRSHIPANEVGQLTLTGDVNETTLLVLSLASGVWTSQSLDQASRIVCPTGRVKRCEISAVRAAPAGRRLEADSRQLQARDEVNVRIVREYFFDQQEAILGEYQSVAAALAGPVVAEVRNNIDPSAQVVSATKEEITVTVYVDVLRPTSVVAVDDSIRSALDSGTLQSDVDALLGVGNCTEIDEEIFHPPPPPPPSIPPVCGPNVASRSALIDVSLVVDRSNSIYAYPSNAFNFSCLNLALCNEACVGQPGEVRNEDLSKQFVSDILSALTLSETSAKVSLVEFSSSDNATCHGEGMPDACEQGACIGASILSNLTTDAAAVNSAAARLYARGGTRWGPGIALGHDTLMGEGSRPNARKVMIFLTDGLPNSYQNGKAEAEAARSDGVEIFALYYATDPTSFLWSTLQKPQLDLIASSPIEEHVFGQTSFATLLQDSSIVERVLARAVACPPPLMPPPAVPPPPLTPPPPAFPRRTLSQFPPGRPAPLRPPPPSSPPSSPPVFPPTPPPPSAPPRLPPVPPHPPVVPGYNATMAPPGKCDSNPPDPCCCIATPPNCDEGPFYRSCQNIGWDPDYEINIAGNVWQGLGVHDPYNDNYQYNGGFNKKRFSSQWIYHTHAGWRPWCYTYGQCSPPGAYAIPYHGLQDTTACGPWAYLTGSDRYQIIGGAGTHGAKPGYHPLPQGAICRDDEPTGTLLWPDPNGFSDVSEASSATAVNDDCQCLTEQQVGTACVDNMCGGAPGACRDGYYNQGTCFDESSTRAVCFEGDACDDDLSCRTVVHSVYNTKSGSFGAMYGLEYADVCYDIVYGDRFYDSSNALINFGQHSAHSTDWAWCYTKGQCWGSSSTGGDTPGHDVPNPGACDALPWTYLDRRRWHSLAASCNPGGMATPPLPPAAPPPPPRSPDFSGWKLGDYDESCDQGCARHNLQCKEADLHANNAAVDSSSELQAIINLLGGQTTSSSCSGSYGSAPDIPQFKASWCAYSSSTRSLSTFDCTASSSGSGDPKRRVCWCSNNDPPAPPLAPSPPKVPTSAHLVVRPRWSATVGSGGSVLATDSELYIDVYSYTPNANGKDWVGLYTKATADAWPNSDPGVPSKTWGYLCAACYNPGTNFLSPDPVYEPATNPDLAYQPVGVLSVPGRSSGGNGVYTLNEQYVAILFYDDSYVAAAMSQPFTVTA